MTFLSSLRSPTRIVIPYHPKSPLWRKMENGKTSLFPEELETTHQHQPARRRCHRAGAWCACAPANPRNLVDPGRIAPVLGGFTGFLLGLPHYIPSAKLTLLLKMTICSGIRHKTWWFSTVILVYQRVNPSVSNSNSPAVSVETSWHPAIQHSRSWIWSQPGWSKNIQEINLKPPGLAPGRIWCFLVWFKETTRRVTPSFMSMDPKRAFHIWVWLWVWHVGPNTTMGAMEKIMAGGAIFENMLTFWSSKPPSRGWIHMNPIGFWSTDGS